MLLSLPTYLSLHTSLFHSRSLSLSNSPSFPLYFYFPFISSLPLYLTLSFLSQNLDLSLPLSHILNSLISISSLSTLLLTPYLPLFLYIYYLSLSTYLSIPPYQHLSLPLSLHPSLIPSLILCPFYPLSTSLSHFVPSLPKSKTMSLPLSYILNSLLFISTLSIHLPLPPTYLYFFIYTFVSLSKCTISLSHPTYLSLHMS